MVQFTQHELLDLQEHIRGAAATAQTCQQFALAASDPQVKAFCDQEARNAQQTTQRLMSLFQQGQQKKQNQ